MQKKYGSGSKGNRATDFFKKESALVVRFSVAFLFFFFFGLSCISVLRVNSSRKKKLASEGRGLRQMTWGAGSNSER